MFYQIHFFKVNQIIGTLALHSTKTWEGGGERGGGGGGGVWCGGEGRGVEGKLYNIPNKIYT